MIDIENLDFYRGNTRIFGDFSLHLNKGERICLFGASGSGKTTLLRLITGLEKAQGGTITLPENCRFSCVFQEDRLLEHHSVLRNVSLFGDRKTAEALLRRLGLGEYMHKYPCSLSGGMARRVAIARALVRDADVYIFDEAFNGLDPATKQKTAELINEICKNKTVVMVSHEKEDALLLSAEPVYIDNCTV